MNLSSQSNHDHSRTLQLQIPERVEVYLLASSQKQSIHSSLSYTSHLSMIMIESLEL